MHSSASAFHVRFRSSSSTPTPIVTRTICLHVSVAGGSCFSHASASLSQCSRSMETPCEPSDFTARSRILPTLFAFPLASSNFAAVIQIAGSVGSVSRALFKTFLDCSYDSRRASASHRSTCCGQHSTARARSILASSSLDKSTTAFHSLTEFGMFSSARRNTRRFLSSSVSNCAAAIQIFTLCGSDATPRASTAFAFSGVFKRAASIHTSSLFGHASHPRWMKLRAA
mmetsp:Transcript_2317/g.7456  ORF Transcript_2317/g.7456 Transcript_2317/m.7456 type:complete len:228 (+) Transcript_2317:2415-3098(+)